MATENFCMRYTRELLSLDFGKNLNGGHGAFPKPRKLIQSYSIVSETMRTNDSRALECYFVHGHSITCTMDI